jgi:class 3 adenylate cyclase
MRSVRQYSMASLQSETSSKPSDAEPGGRRAGTDTDLDNMVSPSATAMRTFFDRHDVTDATLAELAEAHQLDLEAQAAHDVRFLAYWFDEARGLACCLVDAPNSDAVVSVHSQSHGGVPAEIIEVDKKVVLTYLGRVSEPADADAARNFVPDSPIRTIMMTDIVDSVRLTVRDGDVKAVELLTAHDAVVEKAVARHGGRVVKQTGDGFLAAFDRTEDALWASDQIHTNVSQLDDEMRVRIAINPGYPVERGEDLFGLAVQIAARICDYAQSGQTLMSTLARELCNDDELIARCRAVGRLPLKGLPSAIHVHELVPVPSG